MPFLGRGNSHEFVKHGQPRWEVENMHVFAAFEVFEVCSVQDRFDSYAMFWPRARCAIFKVGSYILYTILSSRKLLTSYSLREALFPSIMLPLCYALDLQAS